MAKGSYNISVSSDSHLEKEGNHKNENQECMSSCLNLSFQRSLSLHDRPRSSRVPTNKELRKSRYKALVSSSLEKIPSNPSPLNPTNTFESRSECNKNHGFESVRIKEETGVIAQPFICNASSSAAHQETGQNRLTEPDSWLENRFARFSVESEKLLEKTVAILRTVDEDISESLTNLIKPESIALESVMEIYRNKDKSTIGCSAGAEFHLSTESSSEAIYENWQPSFQESLKDVQTHFVSQRPDNLQAHFSQNPQIVQVQSSSQSPKNAKTYFAQQSPKNLQAHSVQRFPKNLMVLSAQETLNNLDSLSSSNSENTQSLTKLESDDEQSPKNIPSTPKINSPEVATKVNIEFNLPSDHEQFIKIIGALQNRCLEYREMTQDIVISTLEVCRNFSEFSIGRIRHLRKQFESQKRNFKDFKELCCKSVVFGPDSLPVNEKVTEVIQSFYLKLLQEENETFMTRLELGLEMGEVYAKMLRLETESRKIVTTLERELLYLKKTSVGFKV